MRELLMVERAGRDQLLNTCWMWVQGKGKIVIDNYLLKTCNAPCTAWKPLLYQLAHLILITLCHRCCSFSFYKWGHWSTGRSSNLPEVTWLDSGGARTQARQSGRRACALSATWGWCPRASWSVGWAVVNLLRWMGNWGLESKSTVV